jgi:hypothetical protein
LLGTALCCSCVLNQEAIVSIEKVGDGTSSLASIERVASALGFKREPVYSVLDHEMGQVGHEPDGVLVVSFRSGADKAWSVVARYQPAKDALEVKFIESPVTTPDFKFSARAIGQFDRLLAALKIEFGSERIRIERSAR